ncbi:hypothetical protein [Microvirga vignae]|uniref:hypothetical protein n=1 Tax=Microvirga vignae TaxID=1225564 RepID=UPI00069BE4FF|nr:hypothetical protein [Microvirga vignae]
MTWSVCWKTRPFERGLRRQEPSPLLPQLLLLRAKALLRRAGGASLQSTGALRTIAAALPRLPDKAARASANLHQDMRGPGLFGTILLFVVFLILGCGSEFLFWWATARMRAWIGSHPMTTVPQRLRMIGLRLAFG